MKTSIIFGRVACIVVTVFVTVIYCRFDARNYVLCTSYFGPEVPQWRPLSAGDTNSSVNSTTCVTGRPCTYPHVVDFRVIVITFKRADSLSKLLRSLDTLILDGHHAALEIWIDRYRNNTVDQRTLEVASAFNWTEGHTRVHVQVALYCSVF